MKAWLCETLDGIGAMRLQDLPTPEPKPGEVRIAIQAASLNFPDLLIVEGKYQFKPPLPFAPGCELAGVVKAVGEGVTHVKPGDRVLALVMHGAFAEEALADARTVVPIPDAIDFATAASFMFTYGTSYHALKDRAALQPGETLLVLGAAGGVGLAAVELGKLMGARVIAAASSAEKLAACRSRGADETIDYTTEDLKERVKALTGGRGVDVVYDPVGGDYSEAALRGMAWKGRFLVVGFANGEIPRIPLNLALLKGCDIVGVFWGGFVDRDPEGHRANLRQIMDWCVEGKLSGYVQTVYPLTDAATGHTAFLPG